MSQDLKSSYSKNGFLKFENYLSDAEIKEVNSEILRLEQLDVDARYQTTDGCTVYGVHDGKFETSSPVFEKFSTSERFLALAQDLLGHDDLYIYNSKMNCKRRFFGANMHWHQDFFYWKLDGVESDKLLTFLILPRKTTELDGCLYVIPGTHRDGLTDHKRILVGDHKQFAVSATELDRMFKEEEAPVPLIGEAGTVYVFDSNIVHGSSNNMGPTDRWQVYLSYNFSENAPVKSNRSRPDFVVASDNSPLEVIND